MKIDKCPSGNLGQVLHAVLVRDGCLTYMKLIRLVIDAIRSLFMPSCASVVKLLARECGDKHTRKRSETQFVGQQSSVTGERVGKHFRLLLLAYGGEQERHSSFLAQAHAVVRFWRRHMKDSMT